MSQSRCADDGSSVIACQTIIALDHGDEIMCSVWDDGYFVPDDPLDPDDLAGDDCQADGLRCPAGANPQCVCPSNGSSDFYVNAHPATQLELVGRVVASNAENGLSIVNTANADLDDSFALVTAETTTFVSNRRDGVRVKYGAQVRLHEVEIANNGDNGLHVETSVRGGGGAEPSAVVELSGGFIHDNGFDTVFNGGHGILAQGHNTLVTEGSDVGPLRVEHNGFGGLYADNGQMQLADTVFSRNGVNDLCAEDAEGHFMQVTITEDDGYYLRDLEGETAATMSMEACVVTERFGGGIEIDSLGDEEHANTIDGSRVDQNRGRRDCSGNRFFAYVNNPSAPEYTQKGLVSDDGARVLARRNTWGVLGSDNATHVVSGTDGEIDFEDACSTISTCTAPSPD